MHKITTASAPSDKHRVSNGPGAGTPRSSASARRQQHGNCRYHPYRRRRPAAAAAAPSALPPPRSIAAAPAAARTSACGAATASDKPVARGAAIERAALAANPPSAGPLASSSSVMVGPVPLGGGGSSPSALLAPPSVTGLAPPTAMWSPSRVGSAPQLVPPDGQEPHSAVVLQPSGSGGGALPPHPFQLLPPPVAQRREEEEVSSSGAPAKLTFGTPHRDQQQPEASSASTTPHGQQGAVEPAGEPQHQQATGHHQEQQQRQPDPPAASYDAAAGCCGPQHPGQGHSGASASPLLPFVSSGGVGRRATADIPLTAGAGAATAAGGAGPPLQHTTSEPGNGSAAHSRPGPGAGAPRVSNNGGGSSACPCPPVVACASPGLPDGLPRTASLPHFAGGSPAPHGRLHASSSIVMPLGPSTAGGRAMATSIPVRSHHSAAVISPQASLEPGALNAAANHQPQHQAASPGYAASPNHHQASPAPPPPQQQAMQEQGPMELQVEVQLGAGHEEYNDPYGYRYGNSGLTAMHVGTPPPELGGQPPHMTHMGDGSSGGATGPVTILLAPAAGSSSLSVSLGATIPGACSLLTVPSSLEDEILRAGALRHSDSVHRSVSGLERQTSDNEVQGQTVHQRHSVPELGHYRRGLTSEIEEDEEIAEAEETDDEGDEEDDDGEAIIADDELTDDDDAESEDLEGASLPGRSYDGPFEEDWQHNTCINCTRSFNGRACHVCGTEAGGEVVGPGPFGVGYMSAQEYDAACAAADRSAVPSVLLSYDDRCRQHMEEIVPGSSLGLGRSHPERPERVAAIMDRLESTGLAARCARIHGREATLEELVAVHDVDLIRAIEARAERSRALARAAAGAAGAAQQLQQQQQQQPHGPFAAGLGGDDDADGDTDTEQPAMAIGAVWRRNILDCYFNNATANCARLAAGSAADVAVRVVRRSAACGAAIIRPPGHHAESSVAMGFCYYNNAAVAARAAQAAGARRVLIMDWDVHHGNGTQEIFYNDPSVMYMSTHRYDFGMFYPGTGSAAEVGVGRGEGFTVNLPWNRSGVSDADMLTAFHYVVVPIATEFQPDLIIVSAGFDAVAGDPLGGCRISPQAFGQFTAMLQQVAPLVVLLEGGYNLKATAHATEACMRVLLGEQAAAAQPAEACAMAISDHAAASIGDALSIQSRYWSRAKYALSVFKGAMATRQQRQLAAQRLEAEAAAWGHDAAAAAAHGAMHAPHMAASGGGSGGMGFDAAVAAAAAADGMLRQPSHHGMDTSEDGTGYYSGHATSAEDVVMMDDGAGSGLPVAGGELGQHSLDSCSPAHGGGSGSVNSP